MVPIKQVNLHKGLNDYGGSSMSFIRIVKFLEPEQSGPYKMNGTAFGKNYKNLVLNTILFSAEEYYDDEKIILKIYQVKENGINIIWENETGNDIINRRECWDLIYDYLYENKLVSVKDENYIPPVKKIKIYNMDSKLDFGKYAGLTILDVIHIHNDIDYILWLVKKVTNKVFGNDITTMIQKYENQINEVKEENKNIPQIDSHIRYCLN